MSTGRVSLKMTKVNHPWIAWLLFLNSRWCVLTVRLVNIFEKPVLKDSDLIYSI